MRRLLLAAACVLAACSAARSSSTPSSHAPSPSSSVAPPPSSASPVDWATYHGDLTRTGAAAVPVSTPPRSLWAAHVNGAIYAQPVAASGLVVVATERDVLTALDAATGAVRWSTPLGSPVAGSSLPCGDIDPSGITGTPVVAGGVVYVAAFVAPAHHVLFAVDLLTGAIRQQSPVDLPGLAPTVEQQRGALTVANGRVYVPFGGLYGDCGQYKGGVVGATLADLSSQVEWTTTAAREAAVWAPPGPTVAADGSLYVATGNAGTGPAYDGGDAVVRLSPTLQQTDIWAPPDWRQAAADDLDIGSSSPALVGGRLVQAGKTGTAYLLDPAHLGGVGGQLASQKVCGAVFGGAAVDASSSTAYLPCVDGVVAVRVRPDGVRVVWRSPSFDAGGPIIAGGSVWVPDIGSGALVALDPATGRVRSRTPVGTLAHFATIGVAGSHLVIGTFGGTVESFG